MDIKPIETKYNGYKFRSRIEARWAVFFDKAGVAYEYEPEGFDIGGAYYLPDFKIKYSTGRERFVEIKPIKDYSIFANKHVVYFAGPVGPEDKGRHGCFGEDDWRHPFLDDGSVCPWSEAMYRLKPGESYPRANIDGVYYGGPHLEGPQHGVTLVIDHHQRGEAFESSIKHIKALKETRLVNKDHDDIPVKAFVFCWIPRNACNGTIAEVGYAHSLGIDIKIAYPTGFDNSEYWFVEKMASEVLFSDTAMDALSHFSLPDIVRSETPEKHAFDKISALRGILIHGDPFENVLVTPRGGITDFINHWARHSNLEREDSWVNGFLRSAEAARSWRF